MIRILLVVGVWVGSSRGSDEAIAYEHAPLYPIQPKLISQSVQLNEIPTKIVRITKTVAVKVPVAYPVKVPHHIPVPVPVHHPVAIPVPQIVKVAQHVPIPVEKPVPVELPQQVPLYLAKPVALPHPVPVPQPIAIHKPVYYPLAQPAPLPFHGHSLDPHDAHLGLFAKTSDFDASREELEEKHYGAASQPYEQHFRPSQPYEQHFRPSQPDYANPAN